MHLDQLKNRKLISIYKNKMKYFKVLEYIESEKTTNKYITFQITSQIDFSYVA